VVNEYELSIKRKHYDAEKRKARVIMWFGDLGGGT
jgi:hypothetical protein